MYGKTLRPVVVVDPGFFFRQVASPFEVGPGSHAGESESLKLFDQFLDRCGDGGMGPALDCKGFIRDLGGITGCCSIHEDGAVEIAVAGVDTLDLVSFNESFFFEDQRQSAHVLLRNRDQHRYCSAQRRGAIIKGDVR